MTPRLRISTGDWPEPECSVAPTCESDGCDNPAEWCARHSLYLCDRCATREDACHSDKIADAAESWHSEGARAVAALAKLRKAIGDMALMLDLSETIDRRDVVNHLRAILRGGKS